MRELRKKKAFHTSPPFSAATVALHIPPSAGTKSLLPFRVTSQPWAGQAVWAWWPVALGATFAPLPCAATSVCCLDSHSDAADSQAPPDGIISSKGLLDDVYPSTATGTSTGEGGTGKQRQWLRAALVPAPGPVPVPRMGQTKAKFI